MKKISKCIVPMDELFTGYLIHHGEESRVIQVETITNAVVLFVEERPHTPLVKWKYYVKGVHHMYDDDVELIEMVCDSSGLERGLVMGLFRERV